MPIAPERCQLVFQRLERDLQKLSSKPEASKVHRFRADARRVLTLLEDLLTERDRNHKRLVKILRRIRKRAGKLRDLDVQLAALRSLKMPQEPRRKTQLMHELIELRTVQERKLGRSLSKDVLRDLRRRLKRARKEFHPGDAQDPLAVARKILEPVANAESSPTPDLLHQYRILGKRARYAVEFASPSKETSRFLEPLRRAQNATGDWHDWLMLTQTAARSLGDMRESSLVAALHNVTGAKFRNAVTTLSATRATLKPTKSGQAAQVRHRMQPVKIAQPEPRENSAA